jgi:hypothetical protein
LNGGLVSRKETRNDGRLRINGESPTHIGRIPAIIAYGGYDFVFAFAKVHAGSIGETGVVAIWPRVDADPVYGN